MKDALVGDLILELMELRRADEMPLHRQIYAALRQSILQNRIPIGTRLPASRDLAGTLGVGRNTVLRAYEQLVMEGYVQGHTGAGTFVADTAPDASPVGGRRTLPRDLAAAPMLSSRGSQISSHRDASTVQAGAFVPGIPDVELFPHETWRRLVGKYLRREHSLLFQYAVGGHPRLTRSIADYLRTTRYIDCDPRQILILNGSHEALDLCARMLADPGDGVLMEDPGYWGARNVFRAAGLKLHPVPVDEDGMALSEVDWSRSPRLVFLSPSNQYPTGAVLSLPRRRAILEEAARRGAWIIEDDYDNELRYHKHPVAPLFGLSDSDRVIYLGTFSKVMFPGLRLAYLVVPPNLVDPLSAALSELYREGRLIEQAALADFIADGHLASHIRRMRIVYLERQMALRRTFEDLLADRVSVTGGRAGIHLLYFFNEPIEDEAVARDALAEGVIARPLSHYYLERTHRRCGLMLGYAGVPSAGIRPAAQRLATLIERHCAVRARSVRRI
ncbi:MAG: PLP-dependent aminotransferase family protein [Rhodospirillales bacterium]